MPSLLSSVPARAPERHGALPRQVKEHAGALLGNDRYDIRQAGRMQAPAGEGARERAVLQGCAEGNLIVAKTLST